MASINYAVVVSYYCLWDDLQVVNWFERQRVPHLK